MAAVAVAVKVVLTPAALAGLAAGQPALAPAPNPVKQHEREGGNTGYPSIGLSIAPLDIYVPLPLDHCDWPALAP